jgi:chromosomal replication initiator protein
MNMRPDIGQSQLVIQNQHYADIRKRLNGNAPKKEKTIVFKGTEEAEIIASLQRDKRCLEVELKEARQSLRYVASREQHHRETEKRLEKLELDLADARARILSQAEMMKSLDDGDGLTDHRRSVPEIVADVLQHYPGISWEDVKGIRRTRDLIAPRHACIRAVFNERKDLSSVQIGRHFGGRDHTTILHSLQRTAE